MVRLSVDKMAGAIGLVEGVTSFTQVRLKSMQKEILISPFFSHLNTTIWYHSGSSLKGNHLVIKLNSFALSACPSVRPSVYSYKDSVVALESVL